MKLTHARLLEVLDYSHESGEFTWKVATNRRMNKMVGRIAGCARPDGYKTITIDKEHFLSHRLAWFAATGAWPDQEIDHINGIRHDNRLCNLRQANRSQNLQNARRAASNTGVRGISWTPRERRFRAYIKIGGKQLGLGYFRTLEGAVKARVEAQRQLHPFAAAAQEGASCFV